MSSQHASTFKNGGSLLFCHINNSFLDLSETQFMPCILCTDHRCKKPGCSRALVLDGNMKNHRWVCCATYAGYAEFKGLSGRVRTGCPNTPAFKSPYCSIHKPMIAVPQCIQNPDDDNDAEMLSSESVNVSTEEPAGIIVEKRVTRSSTYYKVISS